MDLVNNAVLHPGPYLYLIQLDLSGIMKLGVGSESSLEVAHLAGLGDDREGCFSGCH